MSYQQRNVRAVKSFIHENIWQREIGQYVGLNSRLCFTCCVGLAGLFLNPLGKQVTSFHFVESSSIGKTTITNIVTNLYGKPKDQIKPWTTTANELEQIAYNLSHMVFILDEMSEATSNVVFDTSGEKIGHKRKASGGQEILVDGRYFLGVLNVVLDGLKV